ncbi:phage tail assembly chaperone [Rhizorhabdus histidinilytica]|uniref:phage tail assembly chaperone n=1 Tax=Rhizorhabdus histidinilytica TaxID=439228 RepID=UPI00322070A0
MRQAGIPVVMPPNPSPIFLQCLMEIGLFQANGMGISPTSWAEIDAWSRMTDVRLAPWQARLIRQLSVDYVAESRRAEDEHCPPPWRAPVTAEEVNSEEARLRAVLG